MAGGGPQGTNTALFFMGTLLFVITFISNTFGQWIIKRMQRRMEGAAA